MPQTYYMVELYYFIMEYLWRDMDKLHSWVDKVGQHGSLISVYEGQAGL